MTRDSLDRLRSKTRDYRDAILDDRLRSEAAAAANLRRRRIAGELADVLADAGIPEGQAFEHAGLVVWTDADDPAGLRLHFVHLAHYREERHR